MVIEHRGGAERDVLVLGATTELLFNVEPVLQAGIVNSHDSLLEKTYGNLEFFWGTAPLLTG